MSTKVIAATLPDLLDAISYAVAQSGRTQKQLAAMVGLSEKHVSQMMTGRVTGSLAAWQALMDAAGVTLAAALTTTEPPR